jgi:hypothetical protein
MHPLRGGTVVLAVLVTLVGVTGARAATVVIQPSSQDASLLQDSPNRPKGSGTTNTRFHVRTSTPNPRIRRGLVQFDLSSIPQFSTVNSALLELYQDSSPTAASHVNEVHRVNDFWLQSTVKWNTQPTIQASSTATASVGLVRQFYSWSVTPDVQGWLTAPATNHGWMVKDAAETGSNEIIAYVSKEEFANPDLFKRPKLTVDFVAPPCSTNADCVDTNPCTVNERCPAGFCVVDPANCNDNDACTDDICDPEQGCLHPVGECNDGFSCTTDTCDAMLGCVHTPVPAVCAHEGCQEGTCVADPDDDTLDPVTGCFVTAVHADGSSCNDDGNPCKDDVCASGECTHPNMSMGDPCPSDGNGCTDDICDGGGGCGVDNTDPCDDGNACTMGDTCAGGGCTSGAAVDCSALGQCYDPGTCDTQTGLCSNPPKPPNTTCNDVNVCTHDDVCDGAGACVGVAGPQPGCRLPAVPLKSFLLLKNKTPDKKDALVWKWIKGAATTIGDFGTPLTSTDYTICVFDQSANPQPLLMSTAPAGGTCSGKPCWKSTKSGFKYRDSKLLDPDGVSTIVLKAGAASSSKVLVRGKGANLGMPGLPLTTPVVVQLKKSDDPSVCWEAQYSNPNKNFSEQFKSFAD